MKPHRGEGLDLRVRRNTLFIAIAAELSPNHVCRSQRLDGFEQADLFIAHGFRIAADRSVHGEQHQHLQQVVLYDVANCSDLFIKPPSAFDAKILRQGDLHARDVVAVPDRFKKGVRKAEVEQILDGFLCQGNDRCGKPPAQERTDGSCGSAPAPKRGRGRRVFRQ